MGTEKGPLPRDCGGQKWLTGPPELPPRPSPRPLAVPSLPPWGLQGSELPSAWHRGFRFTSSSTWVPEPMAPSSGSLILTNPLKRLIYVLDASLSSSARSLPSFGCAFHLADTDRRAGWLAVHL